MAGQGKKMIDLSIVGPVFVIILFCVISQIWAWTRDDTDMFLGSDREWAFIVATSLDILVMIFIGGIWLW